MSRQYTRQDLENYMREGNVPLANSAVEGEVLSLFKTVDNSQGKHDGDTLDDYPNITRWLDSAKPPELGEESATRKQAKLSRKLAGLISTLITTIDSHTTDLSDGHTTLAAARLLIEQIDAAFSASPKEHDDVKAELGLFRYKLTGCTIILPSMAAIKATPSDREEAKDGEDTETLVIDDRSYTEKMDKTGKLYLLSEAALCSKAQKLRDAAKTFKTHMDAINEEYKLGLSL